MSIYSEQRHMSCIYWR